MQRTMGTTVKITGRREQVEIVAEHLETEFDVVHVSRFVENNDYPDMCHVFISLQEVKSNK